MLVPGAKQCSTQIQ